MMETALPIPARPPGATPFPTWLLSDDRNPARPGSHLGSADRAPVQENERCVMIVEDEKDAREAMVELIEQEGVTALGARHGQEALDMLLQGQRPSLILLDLKMPVMDGWAFCDALGADERFASIPVAILTASAIYESLPHRRNGAGLFTKPVDFQRLLALVRRFCG